MVGNVVGVMNDATNAVQDLLAEIALVWARRIINMRHLALGEVSQKVCCWLLQEH